jgi:hypothetical protein
LPGQSGIVRSTLIVAVHGGSRVDDHFWFGGGLGLGVLAVGGDNVREDSVSGVGLDARVGYSFATTSENTFNVSFELTPTFLSEDGESATVTGIALLLGYQHL